MATRTEEHNERHGVETMSACFQLLNSEAVPKPLLLKARHSFSPMFGCLLRGDNARIQELGWEPVGNSRFPDTRNRRSWSALNEEMMPRGSWS